MSRAAPLVPARHAHTPAALTSLDLALVLNMTLWGSNFVISKAATEVLPPLAYNGLRFMAAVIGMYIVMRVRRVDLRLPRQIWRPVIVASIIGHALYQPLFISGLHYTTVANSVLILTAGPVWVVLFNAVRSQERITRGAILGVLIALAGVITVIIARYAGQLALGGATLLGDGLMLVGSLMWAWSVLASRVPLAKGANTPVTFWMLVCGAVSQMAFGIPAFLTIDWSVLTPLVMGAILFSGVLSIVIGSIIFNYAIQKIGAARASVYSYLQPLVAASLAVVVLHEVFTPWLIVGGTLIFVGVWLARRP